MKTSLPHLAKSLVGACTFLLLVQSVQAQFTFPVFEPFSEYPEGERISKTVGTSPNSYTNWGNGVPGNSGNGSASPVVTNTAAMTYPSLVPDTVTNPPLGIISATGVGRTACAPFTLQNTGTVYTSVLINLQSLPSADRAIYGLNANATGTPNPGSGVALWVTPTGQLKISKNNQNTPATNVTPALTLSNTYFVVLAYKFLSTPDEVDLWLNPTSLGDNGNVPAPTIFSTNNGDSAAIQTICLYAPSATPVMTNLFDDIRVDTNWAGVTPITPWSGATFAVGGGGSGCQGFATNITLSGSEVGVDYILYTNSSASGVTMSGTGSALTFLNQTTSGIYSVLATNGTSLQTHWMNGSAIISVATPAAISAAPSNQTVVLGGTTSFTVGAIGTSLSYQWRRNGVSLTNGVNISGATTPTLTISPVGAGDLGTTNTGYDVVVTDNCGNVATSTPRAALSSKPVSNLAWVGTPTNIWDLSNTNWTADSGLTQVAFFNGDNVAFDDNTLIVGSYVVSVASGTLFPGAINFNSPSTFMLSGAGHLSGPAALTMNGGGRMIAGINNGFSGGSTINGGNFSISNSAFGALGTGPVSLNSGTLEVINAGSAVLGVTNNINVVGESTLQYDGTGTFGCVIFGAVSGAPGTKLHLLTLQTPATPSRMRWYNTNLVENGDIIIDTSYTQLAPYNATGSQTYNGVISGSGFIITRNAGATNFFNSSNTYSGGTLLTQGGIGLGIDSVSTTPPTIDSGPLGIGSISLQTDGSGGSANATLLAVGGPRTLANPFTYAGTGTDYTLVLSGSNDLTLTGTFGLTGLDGTGNTNRVLNVNGTGLTTMSGVIDDFNPMTGTSGNCGLTKIGVGVLALSATNTYTGPTTITNGTLLVNGQIDVGAVTVETNCTLGGNGKILGAVTVQAGGTLAPGTSIGTLTINNSVTLQAGSTTSIEVNKTAGTSDLVKASSVTYAGTLTAANLAGTPNIGDFFTIFNATSHSGSFSATNGSPGTGKAWSFDPNTGRLTVIAGSTVATNSTNIVSSVISNGTALSLSWPLDHKGWRLQTQTNTVGVGLTTNWVTVGGSTNVTSVILPIGADNGAVFFRMVYP